jgi:hypothetical protein
MKANNLFLNIKELISEEIFEALLKNEYLKLERIISNGHATSQGEWCDQDTKNGLSCFREVPVFYLKVTRKCLCCGRVIM